MAADGVTTQIQPQIGMQVRINVPRSRFHGRIGRVIRVQRQAVYVVFDDETDELWQGRASWFDADEWEHTS